MYLTLADYKEAFPNHKVADDDFIAYESVAESAIDSATFSVLRKDSEVFECFSFRLKKIMGLQLEFMGSFASLDSYCAEAGKAMASHSVTVGGTSESVTYKDSSVLSFCDGGLKISPLVVSMLAPIRAMGRRL